MKVLAEKRRTPVSELEFIGCDPVPVSAAEIEDPEWEGRRIEYWDAVTETAWLVREPTSPYHEVPSRRLTALVERISLARGSAARCFGSSDLRIRKEDGSLGDLMQADEAVYLHPAKAKMPRGTAWVAGEDDPPDVVLEVDNTTDVRRGKLVAYAEWGFPEVWVEVPEQGSPSRRRSLRPELRIYVLDGGEYRRRAESRAFPGWSAAEIHQALNEPVLTYETEAVLWRVGRTLGRREGTVPEDDLLMRRMDRRGHARALAGMAAAILRQRDVEVPPEFPSGLSPEERARLAGSSHENIVRAASHAANLSDFLNRLGS